MVYAKHIYIANNAAAPLYAVAGLCRMFYLAILRKRSERTDNDQHKNV